MSVVIACYNQARFLGEAIESALAQGYPDFEIVVVDDGSTDDTSEVTGRYPGVRLVRQDNRGPPRRATRGWARAGGEYVVFLNADDRLLPGALEVGVGCLESRQQHAFACYRGISTDGLSIWEPR